MNKVLACAVCALFCVSVAYGENCHVESQGQVKATDSRIVRKDGRLDVDLTLDLGGLDVRKSQAAEVIPVLLNGTDTLKLPKLYVTGRTRHSLYERMSD